MEGFTASSKLVRKPIEAGTVVEGLGALMRDWLSTALGEIVRVLRLSAGKFDRDASRYHAGVYQRKRIDLLAALHSSLSPLFLGQLKNLHKIVATRYAKELSAGLKEPGYEFAEVVQKGTDKARKAFLDGAEGVFSRCDGADGL
jgi:hypothetical protein